MNHPTVTRLHPRARPGYTDTAALNDIHALLTTSADADPAVLGDVAVILARSGRPMTRGRDIEISAGETPTGWPVARVSADDTTVIVRQDPAGPGLRIEIATRTAAERGTLAVTLDGHGLYPACPGCHCA